ncbi:MAG: hypothetical protein K2Z81_01270 [Cyanobacteria bacterium]|nr:hypothetical protein [Cyanobacteriota bacterium]
MPTKKRSITAYLDPDNEEYLSIPENVPDGLSKWANEAFRYYRAKQLAGENSTALSVQASLVGSGPPHQVTVCETVGSALSVPLSEASLPPEASIVEPSARIHRWLYSIHLSLRKELGEFREDYDVRASQIDEIAGWKEELPELSLFEELEHADIKRTLMLFKGASDSDISAIAELLPIVEALAERIGSLEKH